MKGGRKPWFTQLGRVEQQTILAQIDAGAGSAREIFNGLNLERYCRPATFREFVTLRKRERAARREDSGQLTGDESVSLEALEKALLLYLQRALVRGTVRPSLLGETRLLLKELDRRKQARSGDVGRGKGGK